MRTKQILNKSDMSDAIRTGIERIAHPVKRTLGPGGLPIMIERTGQALDGSPLGPMITKDGVTVAEECFDPNPSVDLVIQAVKAICKKTNKVAGDGTTTAIVLGEAILNSALEEISTSGLNPQLVRESIEEGARKVYSILKEYATPIKNDLDKLQEVATISANGDEEVGLILREAFDKVGAEGVITVDEGHGAKTTIEVVDGFQIRRGAEAQDRFYNNQDKTRFEADNCHVVLYNGNLSNYTHLLPILESVANTAREEAKSQGRTPVMPPILIVADEFSQEVIQFLLIQRAQAGLSFCAVKSPHQTSERTKMLDDMAVALGGQRLGNGNKNLQSGTYEDVGIADKVVVTKYTTTFYGGQGAEEDVLDRIATLKAQKEVAESPYDAVLLSDRIAALGQGIAKIGVGGMTELEIKERYHRIEDALNASRAAIEEGIIPGGGITLCKVSESLTEANVGERVLKRALQTPFKQILENIGKDGNEVLKSLDLKTNTTYDARNKKVVDAYEAGIVDPVKVTRTALENAVSIAALLSTCGGGIVFTRPESK